MSILHPAYAGTDAISVTVDAVDRTRPLVAAAEQRVLLDEARRQKGRS